MKPPHIPGRPFSSIVPARVLDSIQVGVMRTTYRGTPFFKSPFDIGLYLQLLPRLAPRTVIEIGSKHGGSALWFADMLTAQGVEAQVVSVDIDPIAKVADPRITFLRGDAGALGETLTDERLAALAHPFLVVEDSSHRYEESAAVLAFFHTHLRRGDYIVVEDGVVSQLTHPRYAAYEDGPNRAVADFLAEHPRDYGVDDTLCDFYGRNVTYNPNGWLRRR